MFGWIKKLLPAPVTIYDGVPPSTLDGKGGSATVHGNGIAIGGNTGRSLVIHPFVTAIEKTTPRTASIHFVKPDGSHFALEVIAVWETDLDGLRDFLGLK